MTQPERRLKISGRRILDGNGKEVVLRGVGIGGGLNMENFISGYPATETSHREALAEVVGREASDAFFDAFLLSFFGPSDAAYIASLGMNLVRVPVHYRHLESDEHPFEYSETGFRKLDRVIDICAEAGLYTIIDLHSLPGFQNQAWHSDNPVHRAFFWDFPHFQDRAVALWKTIAARYKDRPWVAGYNPINEPADPSSRVILDVYDRLIDAIRAEDPDRIIFLEGNTYSREFDLFGAPAENVVYTNHDYALSGFVDAGPYPGVSRGEFVDREVLKTTFLRRSRYMLENDIPVWVGEFGPVYSGDPEIDSMRYAVLRDQLELYAEYGAHWSLWTYKDIGLQGIVYTDPAGPWMRKIGPVREKKARLGADRWGSVDNEIRAALQPLEELMAREFPDFRPYPFGAKAMIHRLVRHILISEALIPEFAELFRGLNTERMIELAESFAFENCVVRSSLAGILSEYLGESP